MGRIREKGAKQDTEGRRKCSPLRETAPFLAVIYESLAYRSPWAFLRCMPAEEIDIFQFFIISGNTSVQTA